jgi:GNAT superfamily N-acetyltransferase
VADLLVRLYELPPLAPAVEALATAGVIVRRAAAAERTPVVEWMRTEGSPGWADECAAAFARQPIACFVAVDVTDRGAGARPLGVACYDAAFRNFFGPELVAPAERGRGIGRALLLAALHAMRADGYGYAIIGWASSEDFYGRTVGAVPIDGSTPGAYPARFIK